MRFVFLCSITVARSGAWVCAWGMVVEGDLDQGYRMGEEGINHSPNPNPLPPLSFAPGKIVPGFVGEQHPLPATTLFPPK